MQTDLLGILPEISTLMGAEKGAPLLPVFLGALLFVPLPRHNAFFYLRDPNPRRGPKALPGLGRHRILNVVQPREERFQPTFRLRGVQRSAVKGFIAVRTVNAVGELYRTGFLHGEAQGVKAKLGRAGLEKALQPREGLPRCISAKSNTLGFYQAYPLGFTI